MLPVTHCESSSEAAQRQANFIILRSLESKLPQALFEEVVATVTPNIELPMRIDWTGSQKALSFEEVKRNFTHIDEKFLPSLLENACEQTDLEEKRGKSDKKSKIEYTPQAKLVSGIQQNLMVSHKCLHLQNYAVDQKRSLILYQISRFDRMKTIFGHALIEESFNAPIYNVMFDQKGEFVLSGADDGIIKIWDKQTMNLQASLHSHQDVITDMDISKCNQYLASSSKDGQLIIWDWQRCQKLDQIVAHTGAINNVKFFQLKNKSQGGSASKELDFITVLATCSDDGTIKIFDELVYLNSQNQNQQTDNVGKKGKRLEVSTIKKERYVITLTPEDFRPGAKNKKLDSMNINSSGLIVAGTSSGEVFLWRLDVQKFKQQQPKPYVWLGSSKKHTKIVHFCEFSPNGKMLITGSVDGTAKIWNVEQDKDKAKKDSQTVIALTDSRLLGVLEEKRCFGNKFGNPDLVIKLSDGKQIDYSQYKQQRNSWQCDCVTWSCNGRYAIAALSGKVETNRDQHTEYSILKVWDSFTGETIQDLALEASKDFEQPLQLMNYSFVLAAHPKIEEVFMSGSDGGLICLWNVKQKTLIKQFLEYGIYSYEKYTMSNPFDGKFSPDGSCFVVGSELGNISLFSNQADRFRYFGTRIEQFYEQDSTKHQANIYYDQQQEPLICDYSLIPYAIQPSSTNIGKFKGTRRFTNQEYEQNLHERQMICTEQEQYLQATLQEALNNAMYNHEDNVLPAFNPGDIIPPREDQDGLNGMNQRARERINSQISNISNNQNNRNGSQEDVEILNGLNQAERPAEMIRRRRGRPRNIDRGLVQQAQQIHNPRLAQNQPMQLIGTNMAYIDPDNSAYDHQSDENFELEEENDEMEDESEENYGEEDDDEPFGERNNNLVRDRERKIKVKQEEEDRKRTNQQVANSRAQRAQRRNRNNQEIEEDGLQRRSRKRAVLKSNEGSNNDMSDDYDYNDYGQDMHKSKRNQQKGQNKRTLQSDGSVEAFDFDDSQDCNEGANAILTRGQKKEKQQHKDKRTVEQQGFKLRNRKNRKNYEGMDESSDEDFDDRNKEEEKGSEENNLGKSSAEKRMAAKVIKDEEDGIDYDVQMPDQSSKKQKGDEDFEIDKNESEKLADIYEIVEERKCQFCKRVDPPLIGPFNRVNKSVKSQFQGPYLFHKDCIEVNNYSFYSQQKAKWLNIGKALESFSRSPVMCARCNKIGATIKCTTCDKHYHGFLCSNLHMIYLDKKSYQCFPCRNKDNFRAFNKNISLEKKEVKIMRKSMQRDHLLVSQQSPYRYFPQINDSVIYFFQGHEKFMSNYNCFFYAGDTEELPYYPWEEYPKLEEPTLCRVKSISYEFPSKRALSLIKTYGKSSNPNQVPQIITQVELQIVDSSGSQNQAEVFKVHLFPNELNDFLVPNNVYVKSLVDFTSLEAQNKLLQQVFRNRSDPSNLYKIECIRQREPSYYQTNWESILCKLSNRPRINQRGRRGQPIDQNQEDELPVVLNFWQLQLNTASTPEEEEQRLLITAFDGEVKQKIFEIIDDYCQKKKDLAIPFMSRVTEKIAPDYLSYIQAEMYISLIQERLLNDYYRSIEQLYSDLELMNKDCQIYNDTPENELPKISKKLVDSIKLEIKRMINGLDDVHRAKFEENKVMGMFQPLSRAAGKLTAPVYRSDFNKTESSLDVFRKLGGEVEAKIQVNRRDVKEEFKVTTISNQQKNKKSSKTKNDEFSYAESYDSLEKFTPKTPIIGTIQHSANGSDQLGGGRRSMRLTNTNIRSDSIEKQPLSGLNQNAHILSVPPPYKGGINSSPAIQPDAEQTNILGKRTRSGRQTKIQKQSLNEDDLEGEFLGSMDDDYQLQSKRLKQN